MTRNMVILILKDMKYFTKDRAYAYTVRTFTNIRTFN